MSNSHCVERLPHSCGSKTGLQVFETDGTYTGYCFSCGTYVDDPYHDKPANYKPQKVAKSQEQIQKEIEEVSDYPIKDLPDRKLRAATLEYFGVRTAVSETDGSTVVSHYYPYHKDGELVAYKVRIVDGKKFYSLGDMKNVDAFGWEQAKAAGGKRLYVCCGEIDTMSLFRILQHYQRGTQYADNNPPVIGIPRGEAEAAKFLLKNAPTYFKTFKEIVYVGDQDDPGKAAAAEVAKAVPGILIADLPVKDVNEGLQKGMVKRIATSVLFQSAKPKNSRLINASSLFEAAKEKPKMGFSWPWKHLTKATRGIRLGETIYIGAAQKMGKSDVVNTLVAHFIREHGWKVLCVKPEEVNKKTVKMVAGKIAGKFFHDPDKEFDSEAYDKACNVIGDNLEMIDLYGALTWNAVKDDIRQAAAGGVKAVFLDPITNFVNGMESGAANTHLQLIAQESSELALDLNIVIFLTCHVKAPESGLDHTLGGKVISSQFSGSRAMARSCNLMIGLEGNKSSDLTLEERNMRWLSLLEDREFGETGRFGLYWDHHTGLFQEISS